MKKVSMLAVSMTSLFALTGCGMLSNIMNELQKTPDDLPMTKDEARQAVLDFAEKENGVQFSFTFREGEDEGIGYAGQKDGSLWEYQTDYDGNILGGYVSIKEENTFKKYSYDEESGKFVFDGTISGYGAQDVYKDFGKYGRTPWLFYAHESPNTFSKSGNSTVLNRNCVDYEFTYKAITTALGEEMEYLISIDEELGVTMKIVIYEGSSTASRMNMDMTEIKTGDEVVMPETVDPEPEGQEGEGEGQEGEEGLE